MWIEYDFRSYSEAEKFADERWNDNEAHWYWGSEKDWEGEAYTLDEFLSDEDINWFSDFSVVLYDVADDLDDYDESM